MLTADAMGKAGVRAPMGFDLHTPFPGPDVFEKLPWKNPILKALLEFDVIGFQSDHDRTNFAGCLERLLPEVEIERGDHNFQILSGQPYSEVRRTVVGTFPIGVDFEEFAQQAASPEIESLSDEIRRRLFRRRVGPGGRPAGLHQGDSGATKSVRAAAAEIAELRGHITPVQVVVPSREEIPNYKHLRREVELLVSETNGEFTQPGWVPVHSSTAISAARNCWPLSRRRHWPGHSAEGRNESGRQGILCGSD